VDEGMPMRGRENIREDIFSWENSIQKSSVKDWKTSTGIWIIPHCKTSEKDKITKAYGKSLPEDEIRSIMG
jgi:hypothetical protein